jgi:hypothetical protein
MDDLQVDDSGLLRLTTVKGMRRTMHTRRPKGAAHSCPGYRKRRGCDHESPFKIHALFAVRTNRAMGLGIQQDRYAKSCEPTRLARFASTDRCRAIASTLNPLLQISR